MGRRVRFALLLLTLAILPSGWGFTQEAAANKPGGNAPPDQTTTEGNAKVSRTRCEVL